MVSPAIAIAVAITTLAGCGPVAAIVPARQTATPTAVNMGFWWFELENTRGAPGEGRHPIRFNARATFNTTVNNQLAGVGQFEATWPLTAMGECLMVLRVPGGFSIAGEYTPEEGTPGEFAFQPAEFFGTAASLEVVEETYCAPGSESWGVFREAARQAAGLEPATIFDPVGNPYLEDASPLAWRRQWDSLQDFIDTMQPLGLEGDYLASAARYLAGDIELAVSNVGWHMRFPAREGETFTVSDALRATLHQGIMPLPTPTPTPPLSPTAADTRTVHTVAEGDTLPSIASRYSVTVDAILAENPQIDPAVLYVGQRIVIPSD
jgi:hypothetical protein